MPEVYCNFNFFVHAALAEHGVRRYLLAMKVEDIKGLVERQPFRPFAIRLNNGAQYAFKESRDVGAPRDYRMLMYFGENQMVRIDTDSIVEIIEP